MTGRGAVAATLLVTLVLLASSALFLAAYVGVPNDGTAIELVSVPHPGLAVHVYRPDSALRTGDIVVAVDGEPIDAWLTRAIWSPWAPAPARSALDYTVVREGAMLTVRQPLRPPSLTAVLSNNWTTFFFLVYLELIGLLVFVLRPRLALAQLMLVFTGTLFTSSLMFFMGLPLSAFQTGWLAWLWVWGSIVVFGCLAGVGLHFAMSFPRPWPHWQGRQAWVPVVYAGVWLPFAATLLAGWWRPASASARWLLVVRASSTMAASIFPLITLAAILSYRLSGSDSERRQLRWLAWALVVGVLPWAVFSALPQALGQPALLPPLLVGVLWCALPTALAIAILREGLFDIDVIINRSLVYGALTLVLALAYFAVVILLQSVFISFTGEQQSQLATVLSTLTIAALFSPLRQRLQRAVDRRFFRRKYDAARTLAAFGASLRDEVDLSALSQRLVEAVQDTMQPAQSWLWLRPPASRPDQARTKTR